VTDIVYRPTIEFGRLMFAQRRWRIRVEDPQWLPSTGAAVVVCNHVGYLDFAFVEYGAWRRRRKVRFMAKESVFRNRWSGPLLRGMHHIPVNRAAGSGAFREAIKALRSGEAIGLFPEATISRSFTIKEFKLGAARLAQATQVPIVPVAIWGSQRVYTKGRELDLRRDRAITVAFGEPLAPGRRADCQEVTDELSARIAGMLDRIQREYPQRPADEDDRWWLPVHLGGTAPTPEQAAAMDAAEAAARRSGRQDPAGP
jgi:1-acyl-sn-glycerol-3-phosphate acyltransferase